MRYTRTYLGFCEQLGIAHKLAKVVDHTLTYPDAIVRPSGRRTLQKSQQSIWDLWDLTSTGILLRDGVGTFALHDREGSFFSVTTDGRKIAEQVCLGSGLVRYDIAWEISVMINQGGIDRAKGDMQNSGPAPERSARSGISRRSTVSSLW